MKVLNRQSELYQHYYTDALMRLARVPEMINLKTIKGIDFVHYHTSVLGYVFEHAELELPSPNEHGNYANMGEYLTERLRDALMRSYGSNNRAGITTPIDVSWPAVLLSVLAEQRRGVNSTRDYIDIEQTAHYATMRYVYQINRILNRGRAEDTVKGGRLTLDQAIMELLGGKKPEVAKPVVGLETKLTAGVIGSNPLTWGMQAHYNACESVVSMLNGVAVKDWNKLLASLMETTKRINVTFHLNAPWAVSRLPIEGEAFIDSYGVAAISTLFGNMVDAYYRTEDTMSTEKALEIIRGYTVDNDTKLPLSRVFRHLRENFRSKWLALTEVDPIELRNIAQEEFDEYFELIRAVRVVREYILD